MDGMTRRTFLAAGVAAVPTVALASRALAEEKDKYPLGCQSYSFRNFNFEDSIKQLKKLGLSNMEFCAVHFKPDVEAEGFADVKARIAEEKINVVCFGVEGFDTDADANRKKFAFAKALGIGILSAHPSPESFDNLDSLVEEYKIKIAIHNHGPKASYDKVADTLKAVEGRHPFIGACVDTGHAIRSGEKPHEVIEALGKRVHSLHLKDWKLGGEEQILGEGDMDMVAVARALIKIGFNGPIVMEYENHPDDPAPDMQTGLDNWRKAVKEAEQTG